MTGMRGARGGRVTQDVTSQENSTNSNSTLSVLIFFHFHSTPFLLLSPFPFTHQNSINSVILIIMISLVLSDEGSRNTPKAYKQVLTLMAGVSTEVIFQTHYNTISLQFNKMVTHFILTMQKLEILCRN